MTTTTLLEPGNRIQLPAEWADALGLQGVVALEKTPDGILVRASPRKTWDEIFASSLIVGSAPLSPNEDAAEVTGDDFHF